MSRKTFKGYILEVYSVLLSLKLSSGDRYKIPEKGMKIEGDKVEIFRDSGGGIHLLVFIYVFGNPSVQRNDTFHVLSYTGFQNQHQDCNN